MIVCLLTVTVVHKSYENLLLRLFHNRLFCDSVSFQFEKLIQVFQVRIKLEI